MASRPTDAAIAALVAASRRSAVGRRLQGDIEERLLQSIVDATARLFDAEAASIALFEPDPDRLVFRVASGERGAGAIGLSVPPTQGIVGFVYSTGQAIALSDVASDPRFNRDAAEQTGYVPRSLAAAPLVDDQGVVGVLQVLDKHTSPTFSLRDMEMLGVFAGQATVAIAAARVQRDTSRLIASALAEIAPELTEDEVDQLVSGVTTALDRDDDSPFWGIVDQVARMRGMGERELALVADILEVVAGHATRSQRGRVRR
jgi:GAF domain-containing protein